MSLFTIKQVTYAFSLCLSCTLLSHADEIESRLSSLESRMVAAKTRTAKGTVGAQLATARPLTDGYGLFFKVDALCWHVYEGQSDYVIKSKNASDQPIDGKSCQAHFDWDFGFRVGAGYLFEHDGWDSALTFTWFQTDAHDKVRASTNGSLFPEMGLPGEFAQTAKVRWEIDYFVIDGELARSFFVSKFLSLRPLFGFETAWIEQNRRFQELVVAKSRNDFWGIGPRLGVDTTWFFNSHFSMFANISGALLWGNFDVKDKQKLPGSANPKYTRSNGDFHAIVPNLKTLVGVQWETNFNDDANHLGIQLGYEFQYWWRQNQILDISSTYALLLPEVPKYERQSGDLSINGVTIEFRLDF